MAADCATRSTHQSANGRAAQTKSSHPRFLSPLSLLVRGGRTVFHPQADPPAGATGSGERRANFTGNKSSRAAPAPWDKTASWRIDVETKTAFPTSFFLSPLSFPIVFSFVRRRKKGTGWLNCDASRETRD